MDRNREERVNNKDIDTSLLGKRCATSKDETK
jgi:hypothetical protein